MSDLWDIAVIGGGATGYSAAIAAAQSGYRTLLLAPPDKPHPARTAALMDATIRYLRHLEVDLDSAAEACPLGAIRLVDTTGRMFRAPEITFWASEAGLTRFGLNIPNASLVDRLAARAAQTDRLVLSRQVAASLQFQQDRCVITDAEGRSVAARLVVGADGSRSLVRSAAGIRLRRTQYRQSAFVAVFRCGKPHLGVSTEFHYPCGPFTLVPLSRNQVSLVWVDRPETFAEVANWDTDRLNREVESRAHSIGGEMSIVTDHAIYPLSGGVAEALSADRSVLVGEAAHILPPIGAQGLNLGFRDVAALHRILARKPADPGAETVCARYDRARRKDVDGRWAMIDLLNRSLLSPFLPTQIARSGVLGLARKVPVLRKFIIKQGLGGRFSPIDRTAASAGGRR